MNKLDEYLDNEDTAKEVGEEIAHSLNLGSTSMREPIKYNTRWGARTAPALARSLYQEMLIIAEEEEELKGNSIEEVVEEVSPTVSYLDPEVGDIMGPFPCEPNNPFAWQFAVFGPRGEWLILQATTLDKARDLALLYKKDIRRKQNVD